MAPLDKSTLAQATGPYSRSRIAKKARKQRPRFAAAQKVDEGVAQRTDKRLERLQAPVKGVDASDGYTGREARLVKRALRRRSNKKPSFSI